MNCSLLVSEDERATIESLRMSTSSPDPALLDFEQIREIDVADQLEQQWNRFQAVVRDRDPLSHACAHMAFPHDHDVGVGDADCRGATGHVRRRKGLGARDGQRFERMTVQAQLPSRDDPRVQVEESFGQRGVHVA